MSVLSFINQTAAVPNMFAVPVAFDPQTNSIAGIQFEFTIPVGTTFQSVTPTSLDATDVKQLSFNLIAPTVVRVIIVGFNQNLFQKGSVANINLVATVAGTVPLHLANAVETDPNGATVPSTTVDGVLTINPIGAQVATTLAQLQTDLTTLQTSVTNLTNEVNFLIPLANPDVTAQDGVVTQLTSALDSLTAAVKVVTGK